VPDSISAFCRYIVFRYKHSQVFESPSIVASANAIQPSLFDRKLQRHITRLAIARSIWLAAGKEWGFGVGEDDEWVVLDGIDFETNSGFALAYSSITSNRCYTLSRYILLEFKCDQASAPNNPRFTATRISILQHRLCSRDRALSVEDLDRRYMHLIQWCSDVSLPWSRKYGIEGKGFIVRPIVYSMSNGG